MIDLPSLLIVEDSAPMLAELSIKFAKPPQAWREEYRFIGFSVTTARTQQEAKKILEAAAAPKGQRFDALLLDLALPFSEDDQEGKNDPQPGIALLNSYAKNAAHSVVVSTAYRSSLEQLISPAVDGFIGKDSWDKDRKNVFETVVMAFFEGQKRLWQREAENITLQGIRVDACAKTADQILSIARSEIQQTLDGIESLSKALKDGYGVSVERDADDPVCRSVRNLSLQVSESINRIASTRVTLGDGSEKSTKFDLTDCLRSVVNKLRPCIYAHGVQVEFADNSNFIVESFRSDLKSVIEEAVLAVISKSNFGDFVRLRLHSSEGVIHLSIESNSSLNDDQLVTVPEGASGPLSEDSNTRLPVAERLVQDLPGVELKLNGRGISNEVILTICEAENVSSFNN